MSLKKRMQRIEISLTPKQAVLQFLKEIFELGLEGYIRRIWEEGWRPREAVSSAVENAVREGLKERKKSFVAQVVRQARNQADGLMQLIFDVHSRVRFECTLNQPHVALLFEQFRRMLRDFGHRDEIRPEEWNSWRAMLIERSVHIRQLKEAIDIISARHFEGHQLLFAEHEERLDRANVSLEELVSDYNLFALEEASLQPIDIDAELCLTAKQIEMQIPIFEMTAQAKMLNDAGEDYAASKVIHGNIANFVDELRMLL